MSLQYYDINIGLTATQKVAAQGRYIYYLNGTTPLISGGVTPAAAGNQAIKVQAGTSGSSIILMPGQSLRLPANDKAPGEWLVTNYKGAEVITGQVLVGEGDFHDSNIQNIVKLDATFPNGVKVTNDATAVIPVNIIGGSGNNIVYTASYTSQAGLTANTAVQIVAPGANVNGVTINRSLIAGCNSIDLAFLAKATAPTSVADGDLLAYAPAGPTGAQQTYTEDSQIKVPAGKGVYVISSGAHNQLRSLLYTVL